MKTLETFSKPVRLWGRSNILYEPDPHVHDLGFSVRDFTFFPVFYVLLPPPNVRLHMSNGVCVL